MNELASPGTMAAAVTAADDPYWYKDAVIYQLHVKSFFDSNNDGIGDFAGLMQKLDYIADLGVTAIWLLPFYPSPRRDDGYDIAEYRDVSPDYGTIDEARAFIEAAHERGGEHDGGAACREAEDEVSRALLQEVGDLVGQV